MILLLLLLLLLLVLVLVPLLLPLPLPLPPPPLLLLLRLRLRPRPRPRLPLPLPRLPLPLPLRLRLRLRLLLLLLFTANCQLARVLLQLAFVLCAQLRSQDPAAGLKHHGSEGRIGPASGPSGRAKTQWQWRTDRARGPQPILPNVALNCLEARFKPSIQAFHFACLPALPAPNLPASSCSWLASCTAPVTGPPRRVKTPWQWRTDRARGPQPRVPNVAFWSAYLLAFLHCQLPTCLRPLAAGLRPAQKQLRSQDPPQG